MNLPSRILFTIVDNPLLWVVAILTLLLLGVTL